MSRPPSTDAAHTRGKILDAAIEAFSTDGWGAVTTRSVAQAASVNVATLSYHFGSKEGLYRACIEAVYERLRIHAIELAPTLPTLDVPTALLRVYRLARREDAIIRLLLREILDHGGLTPTTESAHYLPYVEEASTVLAARMGAPQDKARAAVVTLSFLISRFAVQDEESLRTALGHPDDVDDTVARILTTTLYALLERTP